MKQQFLSFIRGINVGGNNIVKMADLKQALEKEGFQDVQTYIQSGNVLFNSDTKDLKAHSRAVERCLKKHFGITARVVTFSKKQWQQVIEAAPKGWGNKADWKHNLLIMLDGKRAKEVPNTIGELKTDIEQVTVGKGVVYQSVSWENFSRSAYAKLPSQAIYKDMTIRNANTARKLLERLTDL